MLTVVVRAELEYWQGRSKPSQDLIIDGRRHSSHLWISIKLNFLTKRTRSISCDLSNCWLNWLVTTGWWLLAGCINKQTVQPDIRSGQQINNWAKSVELLWRPLAAKFFFYHKYPYKGRLLYIRITIVLHPILVWPYSEGCINASLRWHIMLVNGVYVSGVWSRLYISNIIYI